jgi:nitrogen-specific signal transduction histidine kinase
LALSQRIVNQHHGKIEFETEPGWGTKFLVRLPRLSEPTFAKRTDIGADQPIDNTAA